uniref:Uncharacterized protein n=1 Tax=Cacopsylla melanoneura TaxID=428564 RepID=A0A8D8M277_9HEMI
MSLHMQLQVSVSRGTVTAQGTRERSVSQMDTKMFLHVPIIVGGIGASVADVLVFQHISSGHGRTKSTMFEQISQIGGNVSVTMAAFDVRRRDHLKVSVHNVAT